jgi:hypothetical protein
LHRGLVVMAEKIQTINLLPQDNNNLLTQITDWALSIGRLLVILTEIVALGTFLYRFTLDEQLVNLHDQIKSESFIIANFKSAETTFRDIQDRLTTIKNYVPIGNVTTSIFTDIVTMGRGKVTFKDLTVNTQNAKIEIQSPSAAALSQFVDTLKHYPSIASVVVDNVVNNSDSAVIVVSITATLKHKTFAVSEQQSTGLSNQTILNKQ